MARRYLMDNLNPGVLEREERAAIARQQYFTTIANQAGNKLMFFKGDTGEAVQKFLKRFYELAKQAHLRRSEYPMMMGNWLAEEPKLFLEALPVATQEDQRLCTEEFLRQYWPPGYQGLRAEEFYAMAQTADETVMQFAARLKKRHEECWPFMDPVSKDDQLRE